MSLLPRATVWRVVLALAVAAGGVVGLQLAVVGGDRAAAAAAAQAPSTLPPPPPSPLVGLGFRLVPIAGVVSLAARLSAIPPDLAPVLQVLADGSLVVRRPPAVPGRPGDSWRDVAIVVPNEPLAAWSPMARGALTDVLGACFGARPVPPERVRIVDAPLSPNEVAALLTWVL